MATVTKPSATVRVVVKPAVPVSRLKAQRRRRIRRYELRYEISTAQMLEEVQQGKMRETAEILRWMFDYRVLERLEAQIPTDGSGSIATASSSRNGSKSTRP